MDIPTIESGQLILDGCRRLTGPSLVWSETGAILDVLIAEIKLDDVLDCWQRQVDSVLVQVNWDKPKLTHRRFENGFNLLIAAPIDQLYSAVQVLETTWYFCSCELLGIEVESREQLLLDIREKMQSEKNNELIQLQVEARNHGVDFLFDDEVISIGLGAGSVSYDVDKIPQPGQIDWTRVNDIPVALITGTNGKSTSVRLLDAIARAAKQQSGITSTDFVRVGDDVLDRGDYSGPGGARLLLRDPRLEVAFLEVARGGILRRGLPLRRACAALVTNVAADHLGQYGVNTLAALTETKFAVRKTLVENGVLVVNADDAGMVDFLSGQPQRQLCWFSLEKSNQRVQHQLNNRGRCCFTEDGHIVNFDGLDFAQVCAIRDIPMTFDGAALHNVRNALGAVGVASAMGYDLEEISSGLRRFHSNEQDNPGRLNSFSLKNGVRVIVDFAHNAHGVAAVTDTVGRMPAHHKWVLTGSAGDRSDDEITAIVDGVCSIAPDQVVITELQDYLRGRNSGEVSALMKHAFLQNGFTESQIHLAPSPLSGVKLALAHMQTEDLGLFLVLSEREQVIDYLKSL